MRQQTELHQRPRQATKRMNAITYEQAKKTFTIASEAIAFLVTLDMLILFASLAQIMVEGQTGHWSPFWRAQADLVLRLFT